MGKMVPHHVLFILLGDVGDIVPSGFHKLVKHDLGHLLIRLQEYLCLNFTVELICRGGETMWAWGRGFPSIWSYAPSGPSHT